MVSSRQPGFYRLPIEERRRFAADALGISEEELTRALRLGGLEEQVADKVVENVIGTYALPLALGLNLKVNGRDYLAPMAVEEPSVVAAASHAAKLIRTGGGFQVKSDPSVMIGQIQLENVSQPERATQSLLDAEKQLIQLANQAIPGVVSRGGGARGIEVRDLGGGMLVVHLLIDCLDAMGANLVNTAAEATASRIAELSEGEIGLRILSNLCDRRLTHVAASIPVEALTTPERSGQEVRDGIVAASRFAERDPYRAATHNKGMMNGVDAVAIATGNDWRAIEAGVHAFACRDGQYRPLCTWRGSEEGALVGSLTIPLSLGIVGGSVRVHEAARLSIQLTGVESARELAMITACVGMASNLAALRALSTEGIQRGHMALHARSVAIEAGAEGSEVDIVATRIGEQGNFSVESGRTILRQLRDS